MNSNDWRDETLPHTPTSLPRPTPSSGMRRWALIGGIILLAIPLCGLWGLYLFRGHLSYHGPTPTPIIWTPTPSPTLPVSPTPQSPRATPGGQAPDPAGISVGQYVIVTDTGGYGLSLREGPGAEYTRVEIAQEGETFLVVDGPIVAGEFIWWKLRDPTQPNREWWAAGDFLAPTTQP